MSWGRVDDGLHAHGKFIALGPVTDPCSLWTMCCSWTHDNYQQHPTPGYVPAHLPGRFAQSPVRGRRLAARLVEAGLWETVPGGGWVFHDWLDYASPEERAHFGRAAVDSGGAAGESETLLDKRRRAGRSGGKASGDARRRAAEARSTSEAHPKQVLREIEASASASASLPEPGATQDASQSEALASPPTPTGARDGEAHASASTKHGASTARTPGTPGDPAAQEDWSRPPIGHHVDPHPPAVLEGAPSASRNGSRVAHATDASSQTATTQRLIDEWDASHPKQPTKTSRRWMANAVRAQLTDGETEADVRAGLAALRAAQDTGADVGPGLLAKFIDRAKNPPANQGQPTGQRLSYDPNATVSYGNNDEPGSTPMTIDEWRNERT